MTETKKEKLIIIAGPTAVGKTEVSVRLAEKLETEVVSADSMQIYRGMDIGTGKITREEMHGVPHHMIDICDPERDFNVFEYKETAKPVIDELIRKGKIPILCGGTGFYIQSILYDIDFREEGADEKLRKELHLVARNRGNEEVKRILREIDPESADHLPAADLKRVIRAIEFYKIHGEKISEHNKKEENKLQNPCYDVRFFVLTREQKELYERIDKRVDRMMKDGLLEEVTKLLSMGVPLEGTAMQAIGYRQIVSYLKGECSLEEAIQKIKYSSHHYAKRQLTWFKRDSNTIWIDAGKGDPFDEILRHLW